MSNLSRAAAGQARQSMLVRRIQDASATDEAGAKEASTSALNPMEKKWKKREKPDDNVVQSIKEKCKKL